jgi:peroxiredoxin
MNTEHERTTVTHAPTLKQLLGDLHARRVATMPAPDLQVNIDQRRQLVQEFDPARAVQVGDALDPFRLDDVRGGRLTLDELVADGPAVLVFFRFAGCPACNIALPYYRDRLAPALEELGARLVAISPQVPGRLVEFADAHGLPFTVASDRDNTLARRLGITFVTNEASQRFARAKGADLAETLGTGSWELPMPAVLVVDEQRRVRFAEVTPDWMARTDAGPVIDAVRELAGARQPSPAVR